MIEASWRRKYKSWVLIIVMLAGNDDVKAIHLRQNENSGILSRLRRSNGDFFWLHAANDATGKQIRLTFPDSNTDHENFLDSEKLSCLWKLLLPQIERWGIRALQCRCPWSAASCTGPEGESRAGSPFFHPRTPSFYIPIATISSKWGGMARVLIVLQLSCTRPFSYT